MHKFYWKNQDRPPRRAQVTGILLQSNYGACFISVLRIPGIEPTGDLTAELDLWPRIQSSLLCMNLAKSGVSGVILQSAVLTVALQTAAEPSEKDPKHSEENNKESFAFRLHQLHQCTAPNAWYAGQPITPGRDISAGRLVHSCPGWNCFLLEPNNSLLLVHNGSQCLVALELVSAVPGSASATSAEIPSCLLSSCYCHRCHPERGRSEETRGPAPECGRHGGEDC